MNQKTIIASDPDERAVVTLKGVGVAESRFRFDELVLDWRGPGKLEPFNVVFDLRGLPESIRIGALDAAAFVATATVESAVKGERPGSVGEAETFATTATVATLQKLFRTFAEVFADAETVNGAKETREIKETGAREVSEVSEASGAGAFQAEKAKAFAAKFRADAKEAIETRGSERANNAKEAVEARERERASEAREEGGGR